MASLLISGAVNFGVGLLLNFLFPPKGQDVVQEGPRLGDLTVTSSAYGQPINVGYGTIRMGGNIIWSTGIQEVATTERQESGGGKGGGGGGSVTTTTYAYFTSFAISFAEGVADDVLRMWADGKLIYDKTGTGLAVDKGLKFRFYKGTETQLPDSFIEADKGVGNVPAHRGLCYLVAENWPLADFGNRIPQLTAEITFTGLTTLPWTKMIELAGMDPPGSTSGSDTKSHMFLDPASDNLYFMKASATGISRQSVGTFSSQVVHAPLENPLDARSIRYCMNGMLYYQEGSSNAENYAEVEPNGMQLTGFSLGADLSLPTWGDPFEYPNGCWMGVLQVGAPEVGVPLQDIFVISNDVSFGGGPGGFVIVYTDELGVLTQQNHITDTDIGRGGPVIQDFSNRRLFVTQESDTVVNLYEVKAAINVGLTGPGVDVPSIALVGSYSKGGAQYAGTADTTGWCVLPDEEALILSNGVSMFKVDLNDGSVLATNLTLGFQSEDQWTTTGRFGFGNGKSGTSDGGLVYTIDTDDLVVRATQDLGLGAFSDGEEANYPKAAYDPRSHSLILSRENATTPSNGERIVRILLERGNGQGTSLDLVVADLCGRAGLVAGDFDVSGLSGETVRGYVVNRQGPIRAALEPLQRGFLFEGAESDWLMDFVLRGGAAALTITESDVGRLTTGATDEFVKEVRTQEVELPETLSVLYSDKEKDYQQGHQRDKRVAAPTPSQFARNTVELNLPIVFLPAEAKQLAQRWLYTSWAERLTFQSTLPWKYMRLDPTDVVDLNFRGETRQLRMADLEVGADLDLDFRATQEDSRSNVSSVPGDGGSGFVTQTIPSGLPTRLHLLDLPLLTSVDASLQAFSRVYWAAAGYDSSWPGAQLFNSRDNGNSFQEIGAAPFEVAWGFISGTLPDPGTTLTWDESATVDIKVAQGIDRFLSSTDTGVLNGANVLAVVRSDGLPEIIQFVTVTSVDVSTVRLSRLLRGRRGTEVFSSGHGVSEKVVLLELGKIFTFQLELPLLNVATQYKGVTLNTLIEDAPTETFTYTGQDLEPYAPSGLAASLAGSNATLTWHRRTRFNGGLRDGFGSVPLNETSEAYEIDILPGPGGAVLRTLTATTETAVYDTTLDPVVATLLAPYDADANDDSANAATGTLGGQAAIQTAVKKIGAGCVEFSPSGSVDPADSFVSYPDLAAYTIGTQPFTLEAWIRFKDTSGSQVIMSHYTQLSAGNKAWFLWWDGSNSQFKMVVFDFIDRTAASSVISIGADQWMHLAFARDASNVGRMFLNGGVVFEGAFAWDVDNSGDVLRIGKWRGVSDDSPMNGFVDDARIVVGRAAYTMPFAPPTTAHAANGTPSEITATVFQMSGITASGRGRGAPATLTL